MLMQLRLGCSEGHLVCYECLYTMLLVSDPPARTCFKCRELVDRPPQFDRILKVLSDSVLPAHIHSENDPRTVAPTDNSWLSELSWPPTAAAIRRARQGIEMRRGSSSVIQEALNDAISVTSDDSVIVLEE